MSMFFSVILSGPFQDVARSLVIIDQEMAGLDAQINSDLYRVEFDAAPGRGVFDETGQAPVDFGDFADNMLRIVGWSGVSVEYLVDDFVLSIMTARWQSDFINCFVNINLKTFIRLYKENNIEKYYQALEAMAAACQATGGFGRAELPFEPVSPSKAVEAIVNNPHTPGHPSSLGVISSAYMPQKEVERLVSGRFKIKEWASGFWFLQEKGYLDTYADLPL